MKIEGKIYSKASGQSIPGTVIASHPVDGLIGQMELLSGESYTLDADDSYLQEITMIFSSKGFTSQQRMGWQLVANPNIYLPNGGNALVALAAGGIIFAALKDKKKKLGKIETKDVFPWLLIVGGVLGFVIVKKLLEMLGIFKSKDSKDLDAAASDPNSFWNPEMWTRKPANQEYTNPINEGLADQFAEQIYDAMGAFNDDEEAVISVFKKIYSQASASFICWAFQKRYGYDLLKWLRGGTWPQDRLSDADVSEINRYVLRLPKF